MSRQTDGQRILELLRYDGDGDGYTWLEFGEDFGLPHLDTARLFGWQHRRVTGAIQEARAWLKKNDEGYIIPRPSNGHRYRLTSVVGHSLDGSGPGSLSGHHASLKDTAHRMATVVEEEERLLQRSPNLTADERTLLGRWLTKHRALVLDLEDQVALLVARSKVAAAQASASTAASAPAPAPAPADDEVVMEEVELSELDEETLRRLGVDPTDLPEATDE